MDLWNALGISPHAGLLGAAAGLVTAFLVAATLLRRRARPVKRGLGLTAMSARADSPER